MKVTAQPYGQFSVSIQVNYTDTYLADRLAGLTNNNVRYFLKTSRFTPRQLWQQVCPQFVFSPRCYVLSDDTVLGKYHSRRIALARRPYSGNAHGVLVGIGWVAGVYVNPETDQFWLLDYRLLAPKAGGKARLDHVVNILAPLAPRGAAYRTVLLDRWYATKALFKCLLTATKTICCPLKSNHLVNDSGGQQLNQPVFCLGWSDEEVERGKMLKAKGTLKDRILKLFRVLVSTHRTDFFLPSEVEPCNTAAAEQESNVRWTIEQIHANLSNSSACGPAQPAQPRCPAVHAWTQLQQAAYQAHKTVYQLKQWFLDACARHELIKPALSLA